MERTQQDVFIEIISVEFLFIKQFKVKEAGKIEETKEKPDKWPGLDSNTKLCCALFTQLCLEKEMWTARRSQVREDKEGQGSNPGGIVPQGLTLKARKTILVTQILYLV